MVLNNIPNITIISPRLRVIYLLKNKIRPVGLVIQKNLYPSYPCVLFNAYNLILQQITKTDFKSYVANI